MKGLLAKLWRHNPWVVAYAVLGVILEIINLNVVQWHSRTPGSYRSPEKVYQRVLLAKTRLLGTVFLLGMAVWRERNNSMKRNGTE